MKKKKMAGKIGKKMMMNGDQETPPFFLIFYSKNN